ncbi:putative methyltransferase [Escherichia coli E267]|nr:putative methyltransferase [Escherichia coli E267]
MSHLTTSEDLPSATFSPVSASGPIPSASPDGLTIARSGLVPARASLSARQAKEMDLLTSGTFGPSSSTSSASADLSMSLANRLQQVTQTYGSTLYKLTWKEWDTPSGLCRLRQRASARRTSESGPTGWPTPVVGDMTGGPRPSDKKRGPAPGLQSASALAGWVTPTSRDWKDSAGMTTQRDGKERLDQLPRQAFMTGWPTPTTSNTRSPSVDAAMNMHRQDGSKTQQRLQDFAGITGPLRLTVFGEMRTGSYVEMANGVQLNPAHSRWLMGLPHAWDESSPGWQEWQAATASAA